MLCNFKNIIPGLEIYGKENFTYVVISIYGFICTCMHTYVWFAVIQFICLVHTFVVLVAFISFSQSMYNVSESTGRIRPVINISNPLSIDITLEILTTNGATSGKY